VGVIINYFLAAIIALPLDCAGVGGGGDGLALSSINVSRFIIRDVSSAGPCDTFLAVGIGWPAINGRALVSTMLGGAVDGGRINGGGGIDGGRKTRGIAPGFTTELESGGLASSNIND
jgi:hypothetical protein